jgi:Helix-turn-helix domain
VLQWRRGKVDDIMSGIGQWRNSYPEELGEKGRDLLTGHKSAVSSGSAGGPAYDPLWTPEQVAQRLNVSPDWVRDHSSRKEPRLPVIRLGGGPGRAGLLRYRASEIEKFLEKMEILSMRNSRRI